MSIERPPEIPRDHPLAILISRTQRANKLPSCESCKYASNKDELAFDERDWQAKGGLSCILDYDGSNKSTMTTLAWGDAAIMVKPTHFCSAWESK